MGKSDLGEVCLCTVVVPYGQLDADMLKHAYEVNSKQRLQLHLQRSARPGQPELLPNVPIYAHIRVRSEAKAWVIIGFVPIVWVELG